MADEWATVTLGQLCEFRAGSAFKLALQGQVSGSYPFAKVSDMNLPANAVCIQEANNWISETDLGELGAKPLPPGTVVFAKIGEALRQNRLRQLVRETVIDNNMMGAVPRPGAVDPRFLYYALSQFDFSEIAQGTALPYLTVPALSGLTMAIPRPAEQRAIAHVLGTLDDKIELNRRMSETLEAMARAIFKSWFEDFEPVRARAEGRSMPLPGHLSDLFPSRLVNSELGEIPEGWRVGRFRDVADLLRDQLDPSESPASLFAHYSIPAFDERQTPRREYGGDIKSLKFQVPPAAVLLSRLNPEIERVWLVDVASGVRAICSTEFLVLRARPPFTRTYLYCLARSSRFRQQIQALVTGTSKSHQRAQAAPVLDSRIVVPPSVVLKAFENTAAYALAVVLDRRGESTTLMGVRDTLLPRLVSGELRVPDATRAREGQQA